MKKIAISFFVGLFILMMPVAFAQEGQKNTQYILGPGDELEIVVTPPFYITANYTNEVISSANFSKILRKVDPYGEMVLPMLGAVKVSDLTTSGLAALLEKRIGEYVINPKVMINVLKSNNYSIFVLGEVENSGLYIPQRKITAMEAIALAGGLTKFAISNKVQIVRNENGTQKITEVDLVGSSKDEDQKEYFNLKSGDIVFVPKRLL